MPCGPIARRLEEAGRRRKIWWSVLFDCFSFYCAVYLACIGCSGVIVCQFPWPALGAVRDAQVVGCGVRLFRGPLEASGVGGWFGCSICLGGCGGATAGI